MDDPVVISRQKIKECATETIRFLENAIQSSPKWKWPREILPFFQELSELAVEPELDYATAHEFKERLTRHIRENRLKGFEVYILMAEKLEDMARLGTNDA